MARRGPCLVRVVAADADGQWDLRIPEGLSCDEGSFKLHDYPIVDWHGPTAAGTFETTWKPGDLANGVYLLKVALPNGTASEKLMLLR